MPRFDRPINTNEHQPLASRDPLPAGWYPLQIVKSETKDTRKKDGKYVEFEWEVADGLMPKFAKRKVWSRHNIQNRSSEAEAIAFREIAEIGRSMGVINIEASEQLHSRPISVKLKVRPETAEYSATNEVVEFAPLHVHFATGAPVSSQTMTTPEGTPQGTTANAPPWDRPQG